MRKNTKREKSINFTDGPIVLPMLAFAGPVLFALLLQMMYGAIDLMIVGRFAEPADVSGVSTGAQIMVTITSFVTSLSMGMTILLGEKIGQKKGEEGGRIVGSGILLFAAAGVIMTVLSALLAPQLAAVMQAPAEAFDQTVSYIRICGLGSLVIIAYNLIGSIFRGIGDANTPLVTVLIACVCNILGDLLLVAGFGMGAAGAAAATVIAQLISVLLSLLLIRRQSLPFTISRDKIRWDGRIIRKILSIGIPMALQDTLVGISFLVILAIVNSLGVIVSAGVGVAEKICGFIMLIPIAFTQTMAAFVSQNRGAGRPDRAMRGLCYAIGISTLSGLVMFYFAFFHGKLLSSLFAENADIIYASAEYLKAYAIDCILVGFLFCMLGYFSGMERTTFVMIQGIAGAFLVRIPVSYFMSRQTPVSLFHIGLATPASSFVQILLCLLYFVILKVRSRKKVSHG